MTKEKTNLNRSYFILAAIGLLFVIVLILTRLLLNPNFYKGQIVQMVKNSTGRDLKILGAMKWSLFPLGFKLSNAEISNFAGFGPGPFATIKSAAIQAQLGPLLKKKLVIDSIVIDGMKVNISRDAGGRKSWEKPVSATQAQSQSATPKQRKQSAPDIPELFVGKVTVRDATLVWKDLQSGATYALQNWNLETGNLGPGITTEIKSTLNLHHGEKPQISRMILKAALKPLPRGLRFESLDLELDESHLNGTAEVKTVPKAVWRFDLELDEFDADRYLPQSDQNRNPDQSKQSPLVVLAGLNGNGSLKIHKFKIRGIQMNNFAVKVRIEDGLFDLGPTRADLYGGTYNGFSTMDARGEKATFQLDQKFRDFKAGALFVDMQILKGFSGTGNIEFNVTARGIRPLEFKQSLNGPVNLTLYNGKIEGVNLEKMIRDAKRIGASLKGKTIDAEAKPTGETLFSKMTANLNLVNGIAQTNIRIEGNVLEADGSGTVDILNEKMNLRLKVTAREPGEKSGFTVPVIAKGKLSSPEFGIDWEKALGIAVEESLEKQLQKGLKKLLQKKDNR